MFPTNYRLCKAIVDSTGTDLEENYAQTIAELLKARLPVLLIYGEDDYVVPFRDNGLLLQRPLQATGVSVQHFNDG